MTFHYLEQLDQQLTLAINSLHSTFTDPIMWFFSDKEVWIPMYIAIVGLMFWKLGWKATLLLLVAVGLTVLLCDQFSNVIKDLTQRIRPVNDPSMVKRGLHILEWGGGFSFFSAHAANAFGITLCTVPIFRKYAGDGWKLERNLAHKIHDGIHERLHKSNIWARIYSFWMPLWALMVSVSRIFVGKHFLGDVIIGIIVGILIGMLTSTLCRLAINRLAVR